MRFMQLLTLLSFLLTVSLVSCDILLNDVIYEKDDLCKDICVDSFFLLPLIPNAQSICQRGCGFFNIIHLKDEHNFNATYECLESCYESYERALMRSACTTGCNAISKKKESEVINVLILNDHEQSKSVIVLEPELELLESDILSDPLIHNQIEIGYNVEYKIPETNIRTMPIEDFNEMERETSTRQEQITTDWLDCAARNSGIPKWILMPAILTAVIVAVWLSLGTFTERKDKEDILLEAGEEKHDANSNKPISYTVEEPEMEYVKKPLLEIDMV